MDTSRLPEKRHRLQQDRVVSCIIVQFKDSLIEACREQDIMQCRVVEGKHLSLATRPMSIQLTYRDNASRMPAASEGLEVCKLATSWIHASVSSFRQVSRMASLRSMLLCTSSADLWAGTSLERRLSLQKPYLPYCHSHLTSLPVKTWQ